MKKLISVIALLLAMVLLFSACGKKDDSKDDSASAKPKTIVGTWKVTDVKTDSTDEELLKFVQQTKEELSSGALVETYTFTADGKVTMNYSYTADKESAPNTFEESLSYEIDGNKITLIIKSTTGGEDSRTTTEFKLDGDTLEIYEAEGTTVLTRQ